jgi:hypothetical protein
MSKETAFRIIALLLALLGLWVLWQSTVWGLNAVPGIITQLGSVSGDVQNQVVYESPAAAFRIAGAILFGIGLWRATGPRGKDGNGF